MTTRGMFALLIAFFACMLTTGPVRADDPRVEASAASLVTPETQTAIDRGLVWLAGQQKRDGSFGTEPNYRVAVTALSGMAFLAAGHTPGRGPYGDVLEQATAYLLATTRPNTGYIIAEDSLSHGPMYGHGFAVLYLAEVYGMSRNPELRRKLELAVRLIVNSQNREGGWRYHPESRDADVSVTVCQVMALRAARNAGIYVPHSIIERSVNYVRRSQNADGGFRYQLEHRPESLFPRSAAAILALYSAGVWRGEETPPDDAQMFERGLRYLMRYLPQGDVLRYEAHYFYGHYYAVQAMWHAGGDYWQRWYPAIRNELLRRQMTNGSWSDSIGGEYATAMSCIILQVPNQYLPIFQR